MSPEQNSGEVEGTLDEATQAHTANIATWQDISDEFNLLVEFNEQDCEVGLLLDGEHIALIEADGTVLGVYEDTKEGALDMFGY